MDAYTIAGIFILWIVAGLAVAMAIHIFGILKDN